MGNSPSRSELNGDHISNASHSNQESFQSHSYPTKFSTMTLPGIHNEYGSSLSNKHQHQIQNNGQRNRDEQIIRPGGGIPTTGFRTPDPLYSMDSLNVIGNNTSSITSADLPPSSISPPNCVDPWKTPASSFSDESIHGDCRNLSRFHKNYHQHEDDDEGMSFSTFENDSLNPEVTLSGMNPRQFNTYTKNVTRRDPTPKLEEAEEAVEEEPCNENSSKDMGQCESERNLALQTSPTTQTDFSITINGRKVSACEETPLPLILAQKDGKNGNVVGVVGVNSRIGINSNSPTILPQTNGNSNGSVGGMAIGNTGTIKRGRMKSPPPPPPIAKMGSSSSLAALPISSPTSSQSSTTDPPEKKSLSQSLNSLFRRNVFGSTRKQSSVENITNDKISVAENFSNNVKAKSPLLPQQKADKVQQRREKSLSTSFISTSNELEENSPDFQIDEPVSSPVNAQLFQDEQRSSQIKSNEAEQDLKLNKVNNSTQQHEALNKLFAPFASIKAISEVSSNSSAHGPTRLNTTPQHHVDKDNTSQYSKFKENETLIGSEVDEKSDIVIRPCEIEKQNNNTEKPSTPSIAAATSSFLDEKLTFDEENLQIFGRSSSDDAYDIQPAIASTTVTNADNNIKSKREEDKISKEMVAEVVSEEIPRNKTELDCKDLKFDENINDCATPQISTTLADVVPTTTAIDDHIKLDFGVLNGEEISKKCEVRAYSRIYNDDDGNDGGNPFPTIKRMNGGTYSTESRNTVDDIRNNDQENGQKISCLHDHASLPSSSPPPSFLPITSPAVICDDNGIHSKFGTAEENEDLNKENSSSKPNITTPSSPLSTSTVGSRSDVHQQQLSSAEKIEKRSNSSSRRSSTCSSIDLSNVTMPSTNGLLACNRLSLCSLPGNDIDGGGFESFEVLEEAPGEVLETPIQDQPLSLNSNEHNIMNEERDILEDTTTDISSKAHELEEVRLNDEVDIIEAKETKAVHPQTMPEVFEVQSAILNDAKTLTKDEPQGIVKSPSNSSINKSSETLNRRQRRLSITNADLEKIIGKDFHATGLPAATSTPGSSATFTRKPKPQNQTCTTVPPSSSECLKMSNNEILNTDVAIENPIASKITNDKAVDSEVKSASRLTRSRSSSFTNKDFLQSLGEIYASKSKLISAKGKDSAGVVQSQQQILSSSPPMPTPQVKLETCTDTVQLDKIESVGSSEGKISPASKTGKSRDSSIDTVDTFDCQDRSISEYNMTPNSAREVTTNSMLNFRSGSSASSIASANRANSVHDGKENSSPLTSFSSGIEIIENGDETRTSPVSDISTSDITLPSLTQTKSLISNNSGTYKKKSSFLAPKKDIITDNSMASMEMCDSLSSNASSFASSTALPQAPPPIHHCTEQKVEKDMTLRMSISHSQPVSSPDENNQGLTKFPTPPPLPHLQQYNGGSSDSSALSSMADGSELSHLSDKSKLSSLSDCSISLPKQGGIRQSSSSTIGGKHSSKSSGNGSSECSLVELTGNNIKSTSDAIIIELRKAQARRMKSAELQAATSTAPDLSDRNRITGSCMKDESKFILPLPIQDKSTIISLEESGIDQENFSGSDASGFFAERSSSTTKLVDDPLVQTIVNGKHTNSIIVSDSPAETNNSDTVVKNSTNTLKSLTAHRRGNIMSPSLSGNYTEMNGIDSETMGASNIHEDELSSQLKENHINEIHGNVEDGQTTNKLDGASFRRVLNEYEKTLSMFIQQIDQLKTQMSEAETEKQTLIKERDQAMEDLRNVESAFSDVHRKYERAKALLENMKTNEDSLVRRDHEMMQRIDNRDKKIDMIKEKAQESIEKMHLDYETRIKEMEFENAKLRAQYRKMEMKLSTLENDVEQKAKENAQLSALCDELINGQVGQV